MAKGKNKGRPHAITAIGWLFIVVGTIAVAYHLLHPDDDDLYWMLAVRFLALLGGILLLRGANVARWLLFAWLAYHVILSFFHSVSAVLIHGALLVVISFFLFRPKANVFFTAPSGVGQSKRTD